MRKLLTVVAGVALALPLSASAASISGLGTAIFSNQTNLYGNAGQNVQVSTNFDVTGGEVLHAVQTDMIGDFVGPVCHPVSIVEGAQNNVSVAFSEMLPPNANDYGFTMKAFTAATVPQANALNQNLGTACTGTNTSVYNQSNVVHVLPGGGSTGGTGTVAGSVFGFTNMADFVAALKLALFGTGGTGTTTPPAKPACPPAGSTSLVQAWLLDNGYAAPFTEIGVSAPTGFWGKATTVAYAQAVAACK